MRFFAVEINVYRLVGVVGDDIGMFQLLSSQRGGLGTLGNFGGRGTGSPRKSKKPVHTSFASSAPLAGDEIISGTDDGIVGRPHRPVVPRPEPTVAPSIGFSQANLP